MEQALDISYQRLIDQGVLGVVVMLLLAVVVIQHRENASLHKEIQILQREWLTDVQGLTRECLSNIKDCVETLRRFRGKS